jgi:hypothetical protein
VRRRLGTFGALPVRGGSSPVVRRLPLVLAHVTDPGRCRPLVHAGHPFVRLGRPAERFRAGGLDAQGNSLGFGRVPPGRCQPLAGRGGPAPHGVPVSFPEPLQPVPDGIKPGIDLPPADWPWPGLAVHAFQHA